MPKFDFAGPALTKREERKRSCGRWIQKVNAYYGGLVKFQLLCGLYQGLKACLQCRQSAIARETANASEAGSWLYWCFYSHSTSSLKWKADRMWMRRHGIRHRWCYQGDGSRFLLTEQRHPGIPNLQQIKVEDIPWDAIMDRMPEGSSFRGNLRTAQPPKEDKSGWAIIWQRQIQVEASPEVEAEAWRIAMVETLSLDPRGRSPEELQEMVAKRIDIYEEKAIELGGRTVASRWQKIRVNLDLIDWTSYSSRFTLAKGCDPMLVTSGYAVVA